MKNLQKIRQYFLLAVFLSTSLFLSSCDDDSATPNPAPAGFGIFAQQDEFTVVMNGVIGSNTPQHWDNYIAAHPNTNKIIMKDCPGSMNDVANLEAARKVRTQNVTIHLPSDAVIASGAVDFYLAGTTRTRDAGSLLGVHSWSDGSNEATDFPVGHANHLPYINYYKEMGFTQQEAEDFYYFTINAAPAADVHWMTDAEIAQYKLLNP
ncbi:MAG: hypothetical protein ACPGJS_06820 [Flammeovirgaceae bacterium]